MDRVLRDSEEQAILLKRLELEMTRSRDYLSKVLSQSSSVPHLVLTLTSSFFSCRLSGVKKIHRGVPQWTKSSCLALIEEPLRVSAPAVDLSRRISCSLELEVLIRRRVKAR